MTRIILADLFPLMKFVNYLFFVPFAWAFVFLPTLPMARADEDLGQLKISKFFVEPTFSTDERTYGQGFSIGRSFIGAAWTLDSTVSAHMILGPKFMIQTPRRYGQRISRELGIVEAFGEVDSGLGIARAGLIQLPYGSEATKDESQAVFPDDLFTQSAFLQRRDYGVSYFIVHNNFTTSFAVHNGESAPDEDRRYWLTGRWSYLGPMGSEVGVSASTGRWIDISTSREQRIRIANLFGGFNIYGLGLLVEGNLISVFEQEVFTRQGFGWHVDLQHPLWNKTGLQVRYDYLEPHHGIFNDQVRELTYGISYFSKYRNSAVYVLGTTRWEEGSSEAHSGAQVVWKLTPLSQQ